MTDWRSITWPFAQVGGVMEALAKRAGLHPREAEIPVPPEGTALDSWIPSAGLTLGIEAEPVESTYADLEKMIRHAGPAVVKVPVEGETRFLALLDSRALTPDGEDVPVPVSEVRRKLAGDLESAVAPQIEPLVQDLKASRRDHVRDVLFRDRLGPARIGGCWLLRHAPGSPFARQLRSAGIPAKAAGFLGAHLAQYVLWMAAWAVVGHAALQGRTDAGWLFAWGLILLTIIPLKMLFTWLQGSVSLGISGILKQRLLQGALRLEPEEIRHQGAGGLFGRVLEAEAMESLALGGGLIALVSVAELFFGAAVLAAGAGGWLHAAALGLWVLATAVVAWRYARRRGAWTRSRIAMTHDLVERMVGHRTRLVQEGRGRRHDGEDVELERHQARSGAMDRWGALLSALVPRGWLVLGVAGLVPAFLSGQASAPGLAIGLGGVLLSYRALAHLSSGLSQLAGAAIAWREVAPVFHAAARPESGGSPLFAAGAGRGEGPVLEASDLVYRYRDRAEPVLRGCSLRIPAGERILLEGKSGSGKTTLASILAGLRTPESGLLLLRGLDRHALGDDGWRRRAVLSPQFHENHVLTETLAFNLLMGRRWPPEPGDMREAEAVCRDLGLGPLLDRMPAGLLQVVGETGWRLSHGERSRVFVARALLQGADLVLLDESFGALDPESLRKAVRCAVERAPTLVVIAHP